MSTRTITIPQQHYDAALCAIFRGLREQLQMADNELEPLLEEPHNLAAHDVSLLLGNVASTIGALTALEWPNPREK